MAIHKIISGGQTGVDRAALDVAIHLDIPHGGWCPRGRRAEDGRIPPEYQLQPTDGYHYAERTERNVIDSDGTLVLHRGPIRGGTGLTVRMINRHRKPYYLVDLGRAVDDPQTIVDVQLWIEERQIQVLNVAGPRASSDPEIGTLAERFLYRLLAHQQQTSS